MKSTSYPDTSRYAGWALQADLPSFTRAKLPHQNPSKAKPVPWPFSALSASFAELVRSAPASGSLAGRDSFCSICGFALDTGRFGYQNSYPRAADWPDKSERAY